MIAFPAMLVPAAEAAKMKVPKDPEHFKVEKYPHFHVFCAVQLGRPVKFHGEHFDNAKIIAKISDEKIRKVTLADLLALGIHYCQ